MNSRSAIPTCDDYELRFESLFQSGRALAFPCDAQGGVRLDALSERARQNYLFAHDHRAKMMMAAIQRN